MMASMLNVVLGMMMAGGNEEVYHAVQDLLFFQNVHPTSTHHI